MHTHRISTLLCWMGLLIVLAACSISPSGIKKVGSLDTGTAYRVAVQGENAFVATNDGVVVVDIHNPNHPRKAALIDLREAAFGVYVQGDFVYIAGPADGLVIADVHDPAAPQVVGTYAGNGISEICVREQIAYAGTQQGDLLIIDIMDPARPSLISSYQGDGGMGLMVACSQDGVYYSLSNKGLDVLDVSNPTSPVKKLTVPHTQGTKDAQFVNDRMYLSCVGNGVRIMDIADPLSPETIASFNNGGEAWGIGGDSQVLWVGDLHEGIEIYSLSNPQAPELVTQNPSYAPHDIFFDGEYAYLADQDRGLVILAYQEEK